MGRNDDVESDEESEDEFGVHPDTKTKCGRRWNKKWCCFRKAAKVNCFSVCCEHNQLLGMMPCIPWNNFALLTFGDRYWLFLFDVMFLLLAVLLSKPEVFGRRTYEVARNTHTTIQTVRLSKPGFSAVGAA
jgi:hypothetical protein